MRFTTPTKFLLLVAAVALVAAPGSTLAQRVPGIPGEPAAPGDTTTTPAGGTSTTTANTGTTTTPKPTVPPTSTVPTSTVPTIPPSTVPVVTTTQPVIPTVASSTSSAAVPTFTPPATLTACVNTSTCKVNEYCGITVDTSKMSTVMGYCLPMTAGMQMCLASPAQPCTSHDQCNKLGFGYCDSGAGKSQSCAGTGVPNTADECRSGVLVGGGSQSSSADNSNDKLTSTLKYAGIGIGAVAFLGLVFAVVRWRSNKKKRSRKMPDFADVDYGMSTTAARSKSHRQRQAEPRSSVGGDGGQSYPFSNRPAIAGAAAVGVGAGALAAGAATGDQDYYNDQYYDDGYAQHSKGGYDNYGNQNGGYDNYGYGQGGYDQGYDQQGYDQQGYYKEAGVAGAYDGYDQHGNYIGDQAGYYDQQGYDYSQQHQQDYQYPSTSGADASGAAVASGAGAGAAVGAMDGSGVAYPAEVAAVSPRRNGGAEMMSEQDFGNSAAGGAGYGRNY